MLDAPNVADTELFSRALGAGPARSRDGGPADRRIVFTGAIVATKLDFQCWRELARLRPSWSFALVGPDRPRRTPRRRIAASRAEPNIHLLGPRAYGELPDVLRAADAGLIPYARNALTESIFPMKVYEYLAAGLPVVATPLPALGGVAEVATAPDAAGIAELLEQALAEDEPRSPRRALARRGVPLVGAAPGGDRRRDRAPREGSARHHAHARAALRPGGAHLRRRPRAGRTRRL